jgi:hypothetical protein
LGLPVDYYVVAGPAEVNCRYPVKITVVAYQWGFAVQPLFQSADPVEQTFLIEHGQGSH